MLYRFLILNRWVKIELWEWHPEEVKETFNDP